MVKTAKAAQPKADEVQTPEQKKKAEYRAAFAAIEKESKCSLLLLRGLAPESTEQPQTMRERILGARPLLLPKAVLTTTMKQHDEIISMREGLQGGDTHVGNRMMDEYMEMAHKANGDARSKKWPAALSKFAAMYLIMNYEGYNSVHDNEAYLDETEWVKLWGDIEEVAQTLLLQSNAALKFGTGDLPRKMLTARMQELQSELNCRLGQYSNPPIQIKIFPGKDIELQRSSVMLVSYDEDEEDECGDDDEDESGDEDGMHADEADVAAPARPTPKAAAAPATARVKKVPRVGARRSPRIAALH